jgi:hypothetical protein
METSWFGNTTVVPLDCGPWIVAAGYGVRIQGIIFPSSGRARKGRRPVHTPRVAGLADRNPRRRARIGVPQVMASETHGSWMVRRAR